MRFIVRLTFSNRKRYRVDGISMLVGGNALVDISILQGQVFDLKRGKFITLITVKPLKTVIESVGHLKSHCSTYLQQKEAVSCWEYPVNI